MTVHISRSGIDRDDDGFVSTTCDCGYTLGPFPDEETLLDCAMEHAWEGGVADATEAAKQKSSLSVGVPQEGET